MEAPHFPVYVDHRGRSPTDSGGMRVQLGNALASQRISRGLVGSSQSREERERLDYLDRPVAILLQVGAVHRAHVRCAVFDRGDKKVEVGGIEVVDSKDLLAVEVIEQVRMGTTCEFVEDLAGSGTAAPGRAGELAELWSDVLSSKEEDDMLTVSQVAARYRVTPQAVYKWIHAGKVDAEETPGGSYRIAASQFRTNRELQERRRKLRRRLAQRTGAHEELSDEELVAAIRESRHD